MIQKDEAFTMSEQNLNLLFKSFVNIVDRLYDKHCPKNMSPRQNFKQNLNLG